MGQLRSSNLKGRTVLSTAGVVGLSDFFNGLTSQGGKRTTLFSFHGIDIRGARGLATTPAPAAGSGTADYSLSVTPGTAGAPGLVVQGLPGQAGNMYENRDGAGGTVSQFDAAGRLVMYTPGGVPVDCSIFVQPRVAGAEGIVVQGKAGQAAPLLTLKNSAAQPVMFVNAGGAARFEGQVQLNLPSVGGPSALDISAGAQHFFVRPRGGGGIEFVNSAFSAVVAHIADNGDMSGNVIRAFRFSFGSRHFGGVQPGGAGAMPSTPVGYFECFDQDGNIRYIPYFSG